MSEVKFKRTELDSGYVYGECTNEFVEQYKDLVPTITFDEIIMNSFNRIKTDWDLICKYYILDEEIINECPEKLNWVLISKYQNIDLDFINKHKDKLDLDMISTNIKVSQTIKDEVAKMVPIKPTSSNVSKEMLGQMLGLNEEQLGRIGNVIQVGGPDEDEIELGLNEEDDDKKIVFGFMNENNEKEYLLQLNCTLNDFDKLMETDAFNNFVSNLEHKYGTLDAGNLGDEYDIGFSSSEITGKNIKKLMQEFEDYFKSIGII